MLTGENLYDVLTDRGLVAQTTDPAMADRLSRPVTAYCGFDPTADSLHVGSLVPMMGLAHLQRCGHKPVVLIGGATAMVGDPSGKTRARKMLSRERIDANAEGIARQIGKVVRFGEGAGDAAMVNNADWLAELHWIDVLREVGACLSVNRMLTMDSVRSRLASGGEKATKPGGGETLPEDAAARDSGGVSGGTSGGGGLSFLEFNYMVMQAYDFLHLHRAQGCTVQMGGQDQWGNIVMGIELGRKLAGASLAGLTLPLVTRADGGKFGKSEAGNVWLDAGRTTPFDFFQFWRNTTDADVGKFLRMFTFLPLGRIAEMEAARGAAINEAKVVLAHEVTRMIHGEGEADKARDSASRAFAPGSGGSGGAGGGGADITGEAIPHAALPAGELSGGGVPLAQLLVRAGLAPSNSEARKLIKGGGARVHDEKVTDFQRRVTPDDVVDGHIVVRKGRKHLFRFDVAP